MWNGRIEERLKGWPRTLAFNRVCSTRDACFVASAGHRGDFSASGKTHHADVLRINSPFRCPAPHQTNGALDVGQCGSFDGVGRAVLAGKAIFQYERSYAMLAEQTGDVVAFMVHP